jgi:hypothetical protein
MKLSEHNRGENLRWKMKNNSSIHWIVAVAAAFWVQIVPGKILAQDTSAAEDVGAAVEESTVTAIATAEDSVEKCRDGVDNDLDGHVDCSDQDCEVFALCVGNVTDKTVQAGQAETQTHIETPSASVTLYHSGSAPERKRQCQDRIDNNANGLTDCEEASCQRSYYCRKEMYEYPRDTSLPPGLFFNLGFGAALPNYRTPRATTDSVYGNDIPFDPDAGGMLDFQLGYMFYKWLGAGISAKTAFTYASNQVSHSAGADENYKYWGYKYWGNVSGFVRFQWPLERIVPYVNLHAGYSAARNRWNVYDDANLWDDIWEHESDHSYPIEGIRDERYSGPMRHFTFAVEPGIDFFVAKRLFGVGVKAWLPVVASSESETDNVGLMMNFIWTPTWRGQPVLKEKYKTAPKTPPAQTP